MAAKNVQSDNTQNTAASQVTRWTCDLQWPDHSDQSPYHHATLSLAKAPSTCVHPVCCTQCLLIICTPFPRQDTSCGCCICKVGNPQEPWNISGSVVVGYTTSQYSKWLFNFSPGVWDYWAHKLKIRLLKVAGGKLRVGGDSRRPPALNETPGPVCLLFILGHSRHCLHHCWLLWWQGCCKMDGSLLGWPSSYTTLASLCTWVWKLAWSMEELVWVDICLFDVTLTLLSDTSLWHTLMTLKGSSE